MGSINGLRFNKHKTTMGKENRGDHINPQKKGEVPKGQDPKGEKGASCAPGRKEKSRLTHGKKKETRGGFVGGCNLDRTTEGGRIRFRVTWLNYGSHGITTFPSPDPRGGGGEDKTLRGSRNTRFRLGGGVTRLRG